MGVGTCGHAGFSTACGLASNGYGSHSPGQHSMGAGFLCEVVMTAAFLFVIMGATDERAPTGLALPRRWDARS